MTTRHVAFVALGSNLGDRLATLVEAVHGLRGLGAVTAVSSLYESAAAELPADADEADRRAYLNAAVRLETDLRPEGLLAGLLALEGALGRKSGPERGHHRARTLDLDLLWYDGWVTDGPFLELPHPGLARRPFVALPCLEIAPDLRIWLDHTLAGRAGQTAHESGIVRIFPDAWRDIMARGVGERAPGRDLLAASVEAEKDPASQPPLYVLGETGSTSDVLRHLHAFGAPGGTSVVAERQLAGRGRHGRTWHGPEGRALLLSILLDDARGIPPGLLPIAVGLAVAECAEVAGSFPVECKWPNDLLVRDPQGGVRKAGGILMERMGDGRVLCGVGINVLPVPADAPEEVRERAGSLFRDTDGDPLRPDEDGPRLRLLRLLRARLARLPEELGAFGPADVVRRFTARTTMFGALVTVHETGREPWQGTAVGVAPDGALEVRIRGGGVMKVHAADVSLTGAVRRQAPGPSEAAAASEGREGDPAEGSRDPAPSRPADRAGIR